jgi:hypothetical protein
LVIAASGTASRTARAQQAEDPSQQARARCAVLLVLGDDVPSEQARRNLFEYCVDGSLPAGVDRASLAADLARLEFRGHWRIAEVREAIGLPRLRALLGSVPSVGTDDWTHEDAHTLRQLLSHPCVQKLLAALPDAADGATWLDHTTLAAKCPVKNRNDLALPSLDHLLKNRVLWTVFTQAPLERVSLDTAGALSLHFDTEPLSNPEGAEDPRALSLPAGAFTAHVAVVPEGALVTTTAAPAIGEPRLGFGPVHRVEVASSDLGFALKLAPIDSLACLDVRIDLNANEPYAILIDGHRLPRDTPGASAGETTTIFSRYCVEPDRPHHLHVVRLGPASSSGESACVVDQELDAAQLKAGGEHVPIHFDLTRSKQITMLLTVGAMCEQAGLDTEIVRQQLAEFMKDRFGDRFVDPEQLAALVGAVKGLHGESGRSAPAGEGARAGMDFVGLLDALSARQLHRGFDSILDARLACSKRADSKAWDYSFAATAHRPEGKSIGPYALTTSDPSELADIIREPIARMGEALEGAAAGTQHPPYARLVGAPERAVSYREAHLVATASPDTGAAPAAVQLQWQKLDNATGRVLCNGIAAYRQLRSANFTSSDSQHDAIVKSKEFEDVAADAADGHSFLLPNGGPGSYLLRVSAPHAESYALSDSAYRCIAVYEPDPQFWGAAIGGVELHSFSPTLRDESGWRSSFLFGYRVPRRTLRFGLGAGYSLGWRELNGLTSWDDVPAITNETAKRFDANGQLELSVRRHSILLFPNLELRLPGIGRWRNWLRLIWMLDAGLQAGTLPKGLGHFASLSDIDIDTDLLLFVGSDIQLTERYALSLLLGVGWYAPDDFAFVNPRERSYDAALELSLGLGIAL